MCFNPKSSRNFNFQGYVFHQDAQVWVESQCQKEKNELKRTMSHKYGCNSQSMPVLSNPCRKWSDVLYLLEKCHRGVVAYDWMELGKYLGQVQKLTKAALQS